MHDVLFLLFLAGIRYTIRKATVCSQSRWSKAVLSASLPVIGPDSPRFSSNQPVSREVRSIPWQPLHHHAFTSLVFRAHQSMAPNSGAKTAGLDSTRPSQTTSHHIELFPFTFFRRKPPQHQTISLFPLRLLVQSDSHPDASWRPALAPITAALRPVSIHPAFHHVVSYCV